MDIPIAWERSAQQIMQQRWRKVLVLGAIDRGKSTYCRFLSRRCLAAGIRVAVIDADVGQKDIGPPTTLTLGYPDADGPWTHLQPAGMYFVGATSPVGHLLPMLVGIRQMLDAARASVVIINTTGLIRYVGRVLKSYKIEAVQPDVIVAIEQGRELTAITRAYRHYRLLRIPPSVHAVPKTPEQRKEARQRAFRTYFASANTLALALHSVVIQRALLFTGKRLAAPPEHYVAQTAEGVIAIGPNLASLEAARATILPVGFEQNLLCGVAGRRNQGLGLAILKHIDFTNEMLTLFTPVPAAQIHVVQFGDMYLTPDGHELGARPPRGL
jgi:polynucleotide 5'-hydroxyl-kinase GRC3/NOL9